MFDQTTPLLGIVDALPIDVIPRVSLSNGDTVSEYELVRPLARGAFGTVWEAVSLADDQRVAIKLLHAFLCDSSEAVARLRREAEAIAAITHPNVVKVHEFDCHEDGRPFIVMELLEGENLYTRLRMRGALSPERALGVLEGICAALTATHALGIIHRDIKASNAFLIEGVDGNEHAVLLDYGLAKVLETEGPALTSSRATLGTPSAMSPEQIRSEPVTPRTDVYALGALAYHLLTGEPAFYSASRPTILYMHLHSQRPRPSSRADISPAFDQVVAKAMARQPEQRYSNAMSFLADFAAAVRDSDVGEGVEGVVDVEAHGCTETVLEPGAQMLGVYLDIVADPELLADPTDEVFEDIEAVTALVEPILTAASFDLASRRGDSALFVKVIQPQTDRAERRRLLRLLAVIRAAVESRPRRVDGVTVRVAVDAIRGGVGDTSAEQALLAEVTRITRAPGETRGTLGTARFFDELGLDTKEATDVSMLFRVADNSEL